MTRLQATAPAVAFGTSTVPTKGWSQASAPAQLRGPADQIEAICNDFRQAMHCFAQRGVPPASGSLTDAQITAKRERKLKVKEEFDLHMASFCPGPDVSLSAADYASPCVELNRKTFPSLEKLGSAPVVRQPLTPKEHAYLHHCRELSGADMAVAKRCGPLAYAHVP